MGGSVGRAGSAHADVEVDGRAFRGVEVEVVGAGGYGDALHFFGPEQFSGRLFEQLAHGFVVDDAGIDGDEAEVGAAAHGQADAVGDALDAFGQRGADGGVGGADVAGDFALFGDDVDGAAAFERADADDDALAGRDLAADDGLQGAFL